MSVKVPSLTRNQWGRLSPRAGGELAVCREMAVFLKTCM